MIHLTLIFISNIDTCTYIHNITHNRISFRLILQKIKKIAQAYKKMKEIVNKKDK